MHDESGHSDPLRKTLAARVDVVRDALPARQSMWRMRLVALGQRLTRQDTWREARPLLLFSVSYIVAWSYLFVAAFLGGHPPTAPLFPPGAVLLTALLLTPPRRWWLYLVAAFVIQIPILAYLHLPLWWNLLGFTPDAIEPVVAVGLMRLFIAGPPRFAGQREVSIYTACVIVGVLIAATVGSGVNTTMGGEPFWTSWRTWVFGDVLANLVLAPTLLLWLAVGVQGLRATSRWRFAEATLLYGGLLVLGLLAFNSHFQGSFTTHALTYLPVPLLLWAAVRFGPRGIASALSLITILAVPAVANAMGPFASESLSVPPTLGNVFNLQLFLLVIGVPLLFLAALVEERTQAETALQASELRFRAAFESAATGMMLVDLTGHILQANRPIVKMLGYTEAELRNHTFMDLTYPEDIEPNLSLFQQVLTGKIDSYQMEKRYLDKQGHLVWGRVSAGVVRDTANKPRYLVGQLEDITERKRLAHELAKQAEQLDRVFEGIGDSVFVLDTQGHVVRANAAARRLLGTDTVPGDSLLPRNSNPTAQSSEDERESQLPTLGDWLMARTVDSVLPGEVESQDIRMQALDGRELEVSASVPLLRDQAGSVVGKVLIVSDRTERNRLAHDREVARASERAANEVAQRMDEFFALAAHDIRSPVTAVVGNVQLAERQANRLYATLAAQGSEAATPVLTSLTAARTSVDRLVRITNLLFDMAQARFGKLEVQSVPCDLAAVVREQVMVQQSAVPGRIIDLHVCEQAPTVLGDADRLGQVITNYVTNALKYSADDQPVEVRVQSVDGMAEVSVRDGGPGLPSEERARAWEPFHRVPGVEIRGRKHTSGSLGLGLYICKCLVELHHGQVGVESEEGLGATFWFKLPLLPDSESGAKSAS